MREPTDEEQAAITATAAVQSGTGNCDEMSCIAYFFLRDRQAGPLDLLSSAANSEADQHQFVVIGRASADDLSSPVSWSADAVVCDPWMRSVYEPAELPGKLKAAGYPGSNYSIVMRQD